MCVRWPPPVPVSSTCDRLPLPDHWSALWPPPPPPQSSLQLSLKPPPPASPNPARPPLVSSPTAAVCWSSMPSHANSSVIYVGHPSLCAAGWHKSFGHVQWQCLTLFMNQWEDAKTRNIYCLFAARFNQRESLQREKSARSQSKASPQWSTAPLSHTVTVVKRKKKKN